METVIERFLRNALKFGTTREVNSEERWAHAEGLMLPPHNCSELTASQVELNGAMGEALVLQPPLQCVRTKLIFDVRIDNPFLD